MAMGEREDQAELRAPLDYEVPSPPPPYGIGNAMMAFLIVASACLALYLVFR
jgi:hypothetical protein